VRQTDGRCTAEQSLNVVKQARQNAGRESATPAPPRGHEALTRLLRRTDCASPGFIVAVQEGEARPGR
jgi:hypothetical protein